MRIVLGYLTAKRGGRKTPGPGTCLHRAIRRWTGAGPSATCACRARITQMNAWGPAACREHIEEIVEWLVEEANKRGWWCCFVAVPGSRFFIKRLVLGAIRESETLAAGPR